MATYGYGPAEGLSNVLKLPTLVHTLKARALHQPKRVAVRFLGDGENETGHFTYASLDLQARAVAAELQKQCKPGDRALMILEPGLDFIATFIGCLYSGVIAVPAYPPKKNRTMDRLRAIIKDSGSTVLLASERVHEQTKDSPETQGARWINVDTLLAGNLLEQTKAYIEHSPKPEEMAFLQYTSGSTGDPKGVMLAHECIVANLNAIKPAYNFSDSTVMVSWLPLFHDMGLVGNLLEPLWVGCETVIMPPATFLESPARWLSVMTKYGATITGAPNFAYELVTKRVPKESLSQFDLSKLDTVYCGAEPIRPSSIVAFFRHLESTGLSATTFFPCFGLAEATLFVAGGPRGRGIKSVHLDSEALAKGAVLLRDGGRPFCASGTPAVDTQIQIVNPETKQITPNGEVGEIWIHSPSNAKGYWNRPEQSSEVFGARIAGHSSNKTFLRTGDLGFYVGNELVIASRIKDLIIVGGKNHYPQDIEVTAEVACDALRPGSCAVVSWTTDESEQVGLIAEIERTRLSDDLGKISDKILETVAREHELALSRITFLKPGSLPKTSSGKLQRQLTCKLMLNDGFDSIYSHNGPQFKPPSAAVNVPISDSPERETSNEKLGSTLAMLKNWFAKSLELDPASVDTSRPMAAYGIDSVAAVELGTRIKEKWGIKVSQSLVWDFPTLDLLAKYIDDEFKRKPKA